jgi:hypothetical protein
MKQEKNKPFLLSLLFGAFILALGFRLIHLGSIPLSNSESEIALQALSIAEGLKTGISSHVAVLGLTSFAFYLTNASVFLARFWPAVFGAFIVLIPFLYRKQIGVWPAIGLSYFLAISPEMVATSRVVGSPMSALVFLLFAGGFLLKEKPLLFGVCLALGLMSGPGFWMGILIIGVSFLIIKLINRTYPTGILVFHRKDQLFYLAGLAFGLTLLVIGTGFFRSAFILSGTFEGLVEFTKGFNSSEVTPRYLLPLALLAYSIGPLVFGIWGSVRGILLNNKMDVFLVSWWIVGMVIIFTYPGSDPADLVWITLPLWFLSARVISQIFHLPTDRKWLMAISAIVVVIITTFILMALRSLLNYGVGQREQLNYLIAILGGLVFVVALILLLGFGWSKEVALSGLLIGIIVVMSAGLISISVKGTGLGSDNPKEIWYPHEPVLITRWMEKSIDQILDWNLRSNSTEGIIVSGFDSPGMRWALNNYDNVYFEPGLSPRSEPEILITSVEAEPEISNSYRGQDLVWSERIPWESMTPYQVLKWLVTRDAPVIGQEVILWVRTDLMPDAQFSP